jgi:hypothetical protein
MRLTHVCIIQDIGNVRNLRHIGYHQAVFMCRCGTVVSEAMWQLDGRLGCGSKAFPSHSRQYQSSLYETSQINDMLGH